MTAAETVTPAAVSPSGWMTPQEVSDLTGISVDRLKQMRYLRKGMPFYKPTGAKGKTVLYDRAEVEAFIRTTVVKPLAAA
ncbi:helix-turn-helix domain-containing protein [Humibacter ginsenosidimutans]|uniref:Helix-turn-helix domain-containing protein n=1 Tax=Humibacter ginsenosidimutans TaxID=2599293 RepID=A0A5B8M745_9MICO|nr:helix-turn-helix domain-containing protein [Humibacter ginsenosidimutans]QDZ15814.1 helix-turn-helix domain-containing protein [Humibacter ginsenosidimutans]